VDPATRGSWRLTPGGWSCHGQATPDGGPGRFEAATIEELVEGSELQQALVARGLTDDV
jgi:hypothetical protein